MTSNARQAALSGQDSQTQLLEQLSDCLLWLDPQGQLLDLNLAGLRLLGGQEQRREQLLGRPLAALLGLTETGDPAGYFAALLVRFQREGGMMLRGHSARGKPLSLLWLACVPSQDGYQLLLKDASLSQPFRDELVSLRELLQVAFFAVADAVLVTDAQGRIESLNPSARNLLRVAGHSAPGLAIEQVFRLHDGDSQALLPNLVTEALARGRLANAPDKACLLLDDGQPMAVSAVATPFRDSRRQIRGCVLVFRDVREMRRVSARLSWAASHDALTQLPNRLSFESELAREVAGAKCGHAVHGLLVVDVYQFRVVNDTCGQAAGDQLLVQLAQLLCHCLRGQDLLARLGSDEFGILLRGATLAGTQRVADALLRRVQDWQFSWGQHQFKPAVSIGAMAVDADCESEGQALAAASAACAEARDAGRNRIHLHHHLNSETVRRRRDQMHWVAKLTAALAEDRLALFAQPIQPLASGADARHFEVLVRLRDEAGALVAPGEFLPAAERFGLMDEIDRTVLLKLIEHMAAHPASSDSYAVNLSGVTLSDESFTDFVLAEIAASGIDARRLHFEITETAAVANFQAAAAFMRKLKALGCRFYLDDFGSGLSSFAYLKGLPVDFLKIDGNFVRALAPGSIDYAMVSSINHLAQVLGLQTVAECVENAEVLALLKEIGVGHVQGYHIARPAPIEGF